jgi:transcription termination/antitermination protein NusG
VAGDRRQDGRSKAKKMGVLEIPAAALDSPGEMPAEYFEPRWYAAWTRSRHEKAVAEQLERKAVETFLPVYETVRQWKNGRHRVALPLFPGYAFVRIALRDRLEVLKVPGVVRLVGFNGAPTPLEDEEIEGLRRALAQGVRATPHPFLTVGRRVRITAGPLAGHEGILVRRKGHCRVVLSMDLIMRSIIVDMETAGLEPA